MMFFICLVLDRCCLMSLVRSISRGYLGNYLNVSSGRGHLVTKTGMCCSHLQRNESDPLIIRVREGTLTLYSSPLKLELFLFFVNFSSTYLCLCRQTSFHLLLFPEFCCVNVTTTVQKKKTLFDDVFSDTKFVS